MTAPERLLGGRYEVGELLGYGGMAEVHRGRDLRLNRDVAVKMLRTDLARDHTFQMRFRREAQNAATLNHPGIVAVYDTGEEHAATGEALPYIVMEYVSGRTLKDILAAEQRLQARNALEVAADICAALEFSHRHGIVHRDVKPGNVMITPSNQVKVMDFGIARDLASGATTMTQTSAVIGTAQYLSPEQARGESVDARSDVYATGCVLFELLVGHPPFVGDSPVSVAYQHVREDPRPPSDLNPEVGPDVDAVVLKALAKNPANRYQSAAEMRADLLRAASGRQVLATPVMPAAETAMIGQGGGPEPARVGDPGRRHASTWVLVTLGVLGVLAVVALVVGLVLASQAPDEVDVPDVVGMSEEDAVDELRSVNLDPDSGLPVTEDCTQSENQVERLDPAAGEAVEENATVTYHMCTAPDEVDIPMDLSGSNAELAEQQLVGMGLEVERVTEESAQEQGTVIRTEPEAGTTVEVGSQVTLVVSEGGIVGVPSVVGDTADRAEGVLDQAGFEVERQQAEEAPPSPDDTGTVARQDPAAEEDASQGTTVTIYVYRSGQPLEVSAEIINAEDGTVELTWDNDIYGGVEIDWGDGDTDVSEQAEGNTTHPYELAAGEEPTFEIVVTADDEEYSGRRATATVDFSPAGE